jgi:hypothetical protein
VFLGKWLMGCAVGLILNSSRAEEEVWTAGPGEGLKIGTNGIELAGGPGIGLGSLAGTVDHQLIYFSGAYSWTISGLVGDPHWYRGNFSVIGEIFGGAQYNSRTSYFVGSTPLLRYSVATGSRWLPFAEGGFGPALTDIGEPDLSSRLQFNIQGGIGTHYFWNDHQALTFRLRWFHFSNGGFERPNIGVNCGLILVGTTWLF